MSESQTFKVSTTVEIPQARVQDLLVGALEGGSNYWYMIDRYILAEGIEKQDFSAGGKLTDPESYYHPTQIIPFHPGCALVIGDIEGDEGFEAKNLDLENIQKGLQVMANKYPAAFAAFIAENDDADTSDTFLQCCLFGECVFG